MEKRTSTNQPPASKFPGTVRCEDLRVAIIDTDESFRSALAANLRDDGHHVREYPGPLDTRRVDVLADIGVLVIEYEMGSENGLTFADSFHRLRPHVPVVLVTGYCTHHLKEQIAARDFVQLRCKPFDYDELHRLLHRTADAWRLRHVGLQ